jgi:hypothetical protein
VNVVSTAHRLATAPRPAIAIGVEVWASSIITLLMVEFRLDVGPFDAMRAANCTGGADPDIET